MRRLILRGNILTPEEERPSAVVTIEDGRIVAVESEPTAPKRMGEMAERCEEGERTIQVSAGWIVPGFIDLQINGGFGRSFTCGPTEIAEICRLLPSCGVTSFLPTIISSPLGKYTSILENLHLVDKMPSWAHILGVHLEGPFLNPRFKGAHHEAYLRPPNLRDLEEILSADGVAMVTLAPELPGAEVIIRALRDQGVVVAVGHSAATYDEAILAIEWGVSYGTHLFNAMPSFHHRQPRLGEALLTDQRVRVGLIVDNVHLHPATVKLAYLTKGPRGITLVTDAMEGMGMSPGRYHLGEAEVIIDATSAHLSDGTLSGSILTMDRAVRNIINCSGCTLREAVEMASLTPARVLGIDGSKGKIAAGYDADMAILSPQLEVLMTIVGGEVAYRADMLRG
ncbi:MAG: N-acetylglucosamine-6-phosphate deacetylase [Chloroflexi bacterium]|nr:N-acetylglucosamine-6-phosphate deacetylase [Chloroflexota bacterium]MCL5075974.1 N-acetylglucosamine-6-phosphate deacetylase [Chloroflexota bacterium]